MKLQFINNISLDVISGGNIYNNAVIDGLKQKGVFIDYIASPSEKNYDVSIIDSLCMNEIHTNNLNQNKNLIALIHQLPKLDSNTLDFYKTYSKFIVTGEPTKEMLIKDWQVNEDNISIIRPGIPKQWKTKKTFNNKPKRIIIVSNFIENKGFEMLIKLLKVLNPLNIEFDIIGNNKLDEIYADNIIRSIKQTNANVNFHFNLTRDDIYNRLINADIFLSLSKSESFGMAIFEALSLGLPSIAYKTGDYKYFDNHSNYIGIDDYSESSFSKHIEEWINNPITYKTYCNTKIRNKRYWKQVIDEFSGYLKNTKVC